MTQISCFGSVLALNDGVTCRGCNFFSNCTQAVAGKRPAFLKSLVEYHDNTGEAMSIPWMTKAERKKVRSKQKTAEASQIADRQFKRDGALLLLKRNLDLEHHAIIEDMLIDNIDLNRSSVSDFKIYAKPFAVIADRLNAEGMGLRREFIIDLTLNYNYSIKRADEQIKAATRTLKVFRAVRQYGMLLEIK